MILLARNDLYPFDCTPEADGFNALMSRPSWCRSDRSALHPVVVTGYRSPWCCHRPQLTRELTDALNEVLRPVRQHRRVAAADPSELDRILATGNA